MQSVPITTDVRISIRARCTSLCDNVCQWLATGRWFSSGPPLSSNNKNDILIKVALNTTKQQTNIYTNSDKQVSGNVYVYITGITLLLTDFVCLYTYEFWLSLCKIVRSSVIWLLPLFTHIHDRSLWQLFCLFCSSIVINTVIVTAGTFES